MGCAQGRQGGGRGDRKSKDVVGRGDTDLDELPEDNPTLTGRKTSRLSISVSDAARRISQIFDFSTTRQKSERIRQSDRELVRANVTIPVPLRFYRSEDGDWDKALQRWRDTFKWRAQKHADAALLDPHPEYNVMKKFYPHYFYGEDNDGHLCYWIIPGQLNLTALQDHGIDENKFLFHVMWCLEYCWQELRRKETDRLTVVLDMTGVKMRDLRGEAMKIIKKSIKMISTHYPERSFQIMVINVPSWFGTVFSMVKPLLRQKTRKKIQMFKKREVLQSLKTRIPEDQLPVEYGGKCLKHFLQSPEEEKMREYAEGVVLEHGQDMMPIDQRWRT